MDTESRDTCSQRKFSFGCSIIRAISMDAKGRAKRTQKNLKKNGILPLVPLSLRGARREVVEEIIERLMQPGKPIRKELLALTRLFASLAFESQEDQKWLKRRFEMLKDILRETPAFQQILEEGREEGRESLRQKLLDLVQVRYSELFALAQQQLPLIQQIEVLEDLFLKIAIAATVEDARKALLTKQ